MTTNYESANPFKNPKPFSIGDLTQTPDLKSISYTSFDFFSIKERVIEYIKKYFPDDFNDFVESSLGIMLIESWAFMADLLSFKLDLNVNEVFIDTVSQRKNVHRIARLFNYPVRPPRAATTRIAASIAAQYNFNVKINRGTSFNIPSRDGQILDFQLYAVDEDWNPILDEDIMIPAGSTTNLSVIAVEGSNRTLFKASDGSKFQRFDGTDNNILEGSVKIYINGSQWYQVEFFDEQDNGPYYLVHYDENFRPTIIFGDDVRGRIPPADSEIRIEYRYGGGERGNISVGYIQQTLNITSDEVPGSVPVDITNYTAAEGGESAEELDSIKLKLPLWTKAQNRAVSGEDYSFLAESFATLYNGRIGKAKAVLRNSGCSGNIIDIYILQIDGINKLKTANPTLKAKLIEELDSKKMLTDYTCIKDASQVFQNISISIGINKFNSENRKEIHESIQDNIDQFFSLARWSIGQPLKKSDLINFINTNTNIVSIDAELEQNNQNLSSGSDELIVDFWKIIRPGNISIGIQSIE